MLALLLFLSVRSKEMTLSYGDDFYVMTFLRPKGKGRIGMQRERKAKEGKKKSETHERVDEKRQADVRGPKTEPGQFARPKKEKHVFSKK